MNIHFVSLGCDKNLVDSEIMLGLIRECHRITDDPAEADIIIVNTCGFIADALQESIDTILEMSQYKNGRLRALVAAGCLPQRYRERVAEELPEVDALIGTGDIGGILDVIRSFETGDDTARAAQFRISDNSDVDESLAMKRMITTPGYFGFLKIAEGCDNHCTYCVIPQIRGGYRSRPMDGLVREAAMLAEKGVKEIIFVAQDTTLYGTDIYEKPTLHELIKRVSDIDGIEWIRLLYCYPENITGELIEEMSANPKVCHYIDMPVQHADDGVLKLMGRRSTEQGLRDIISKLRERMPDIAIRTTLIVGFPQETDEAFARLESFVKDTRFDRLGVFAYSREEGTPAYKLPGQIKKSVKSARLNAIMEAQQRISREKNEELVGRTMKVIVDGKVDGSYCGRSYRDAYDIDGMVFFESGDEIMSGEFVDVLITGAEEYDLYGEIVK